LAPEGWRYLTRDGILLPHGSLENPEGPREDAAMVRIASTGASRKALVARLQQAYANHATRPIRRIHALLGPADGKAVFEVAQLMGVGEQTVRDWLHAFVLQGVASLVYRLRPGRPPMLTASQRQAVRQLLVDGPEAAGYASACRTAGMIADLIRLRFRVDYSPRYVCHLLDQLGFSYQKGKFTALLTLAPALSKP
jgi:transposase